MKYLDVERFNTLTALINGMDLGDRSLDCRLEAYSCKAAGDDKKLSKELERQYMKELAQSPPGSQGSSLGDFTEHNTRRLLINLIITMNAAYPDYDFSSLKPDQFARESLGVVVNNVNSRLAEVMSANGEVKGFLEQLWHGMDDTLGIKDCQVYTYISDLENDPFSLPGSLWSFNYFLYSIKEKKIVFFTCSCGRKYKGDYNVEIQDCDDEDNDGMGEFEEEDGLREAADGSDVELDMEVDNDDDDQGEDEENTTF